jgi:hypothetical protein
MLVLVQILDGCLPALCGMETNGTHALQMPASSKAIGKMVNSHYVLPHTWINDSFVTDRQLNKTMQ